MPDIQCLIANPKGTYVKTNRAIGAHYAIETGCDYCLQIDSDMSFPNNALRRLLAANKDVIGTNYVKRMPPFHSLAQGVAQRVSGVVEAERLPFGFILIRTKVFRSIPEPWFCDPWAKNDIMGEDYWFCDLARKHGFSVWMDTDLSLEIVHWGEIGFRWTGEGRGFEMVTSINDPIGERNGKMAAA